MSSYTDFLPKAGGGGVDTLGVTVQLSGKLNPLLEIDGKTYLKEGFTITPAGGDGSTFAEAFEKLSNKDGKGWEVFSTSEKNWKDGAFMGIVQTKTQGIFAVTVTTQTHMHFYQIDVERKTIKKVFSKYASDIGSDYKFTGTSVCCVDDTLFIPVSEGMFMMVNTANNFSFSSSNFGSGGSGNTLAKMIVMDPGSDKSDMAYLFAYEPQNGSTTAMVEFNRTTKSVNKSITGKMSEMNGSIKAAISFSEKMDNRVTIAVTTYGEMFWLKSSGITMNYEDWYKRTNAYPGIGDSQFQYIGYSVEADLVYYGATGGEYQVTNPRGTSLDGDSGPNVEYGRFFGPLGSGPFWFNMGKHLYMNPGQGFGSAMYYKFNSTTRQWETVKKESTMWNFYYSLSDSSKSIQLASGAVLGCAYAGRSTETSLPGVTTAMALSRDVISTPIDYSNVNGLVNYMRIK